MKSVRGDLQRVRFDAFEVDFSTGELRNISYQERAPWMVLLKRDPRLDSLRADQRYGSLLQLMNFPS